MVPGLATLSPTSGENGSVVENSDSLQKKKKRTHTRTPVNPIKHPGTHSLNTSLRFVGLCKRVTGFFCRMLSILCTYAYKQCRGTHRVLTRSGTSCWPGEAKNKQANKRDLYTGKQKHWVNIPLNLLIFLLREKMEMEEEMGEKNVESTVHIHWAKKRRGVGFHRISALSSASQTLINSTRSSTGY